MIFNRFAAEARGCVEEACIQGHDSVGDEDLLLGILCTQEGPAVEALSSLGVTLRGARERSERMFSDALSSVGISLEEVRREAGVTFELSVLRGRRLPFSPRAKKPLERALREAVRLRDNRIGTEHVLLGVLRNKEGTAVRMLAGMDVSPEEVEVGLFELRNRSSS